MSLDRRAFLARLATAGFSTMAFRQARRLRVLAQKTSLGFIDVHHHFVPAFYFSESKEHIAAAAGGRIHPGYANWTADKALEAMDQHGVATAILSLSTPGVWFGHAQAAADLARRVNEYAADLVQRHSGRFGFFAVVPLPNAEASLREIEYALRVLKANGLGLMTSYDDKWLGDGAYEGVFEELNRRKAVVFVHPTTGLCCRTLTPDLNPIMLEIPQDTARAVTNLLFSGMLTKYKDIRYIFTHAGGSVPMMLGRMHQYAPKNFAEKLPNGIEYEIRRLYYDLAGTAFRPAVAALTSIVSTSQILFGSDNPFIPLAETIRDVKQLGFSEADVQQICRDNVLKLLPGLKMN